MAFNLDEALGDDPLEEDFLTSKSTSTSQTINDTFSEKEREVSNNVGTSIFIDLPWKDNPLEVDLGEKTTAFTIGIGRGMTEVARGITQIANDYPEIVNMAKSVGIDMWSDEELKEDTKAFRALTNDDRLGWYAFGGEVGGMLVEPVGLATPMIRGSNLITKMIGASATGAAFGALSEEEEGGFSRAGMAVTGAVVGPALVLGSKMAMASAKKGGKLFRKMAEVSKARQSKATKPAQASPVSKGAASVNSNTIDTSGNVGKAVRESKPHLRNAAAARSDFERAKESLPPGVFDDISDISDRQIEGSLGTDPIKEMRKKALKQHYTSDEEIVNHMEEFTALLDGWDFGGKQGDAQIVMMASRLGMDTDTIFKMMKQVLNSGTGASPTPKLLAASWRVAQLSQEGRELAQGAIERAKVANGGNGAVSAQDRLRIIRNVTEMLGVKRWVDAGRSEVGRALRILQKVDAFGTNKESIALREMMEQVGDINELMATNPEIVDSIIEKMANSTDILSYERLARPLASPSLGEKGIFFMLNNMLMNPQTHVVNMVSNAGMQLLGNGDKFMQAVLGMGQTSAERVTFREYAQFTTGQIKGLRAGARLAKEIALGRAEPLSAQTKLELLRRTEIKKQLINDFSKVMPRGMAKAFIGLTDIPGRALVAGDEFFKTMSRFGESRALATKDVIKQVTSAKAQDLGMPKYGTKGFYDMIDDTHQKIMAGERSVKPLGKKMEQLAEELTFTERPPSTIEDMMRFSNRHIWLKGMLPFIRTPVNIVRQAGRHSPLQVLRTNMWREAAQGDTKALAQTMLGSALWAGTYMMAQNGYISGIGPVNSRLRQEREDAGIPSQSFHIKKFLKDNGVAEETQDEWAKAVGFKDGMPEWASYSRFDPLGMTFGLVADFNELANLDATHSAEDRDKVSFLMATITQNLVNKTYLGTVADFMEVFGGVAVPEAAERFTKNYLLSLSMAVPGVGPGVNPMTSNLARTVDPRRVETSGDPSKEWLTIDAENNRFLDSMRKEVMARNPIWRDDVQPQRNVLGEIVYYGGKPPENMIEKVYHFFNPAYFHSPDTSTLKAEIFNLGINIEKPKRKIGDITLDDTQYDFYLKRSGEIFKERFGSILGEQPVGETSIDPETRRIITENMTSAQLKKQFSGLQAGMRKRLIEKFLRQSRKQARMELQMSYPELLFSEQEEKLNELFLNVNQ